MKMLISMISGSRIIKKHYVLKVFCNLAAGDRNHVKLGNENLEIAKHHEFHHENMEIQCKSWKFMEFMCSKHMRFVRSPMPFALFSANGIESAVKPGFLAKFS